MWPNLQETAGWSHLLKKYLMENFIFLCSGLQKMSPVANKEKKSKTEW